MTDQASDAVVPPEGWHVLHLFYKIEYGQWQLLTSEEQREAKTQLSSLVQEVRATADTQLLVFSMVSPKADIGFMLLTPDLHVANAFEKRLTMSLGADVLSSVFSYLSMTERSEYAPTYEAYSETLVKEQGLEPGTEEHTKALQEFSGRMKKYVHARLYPALPDWPVFCFYTMLKRRVPGQNWYALSYDQRKELMSGHARIGKTWHGRVQQLITGSAGLDDAEWGVTLFSPNTFHIKGIIYEMRFDPVSAEYAEFGEFYIGLQVPLDEMFRRLLL